MIKRFLLILALVLVIALGLLILKNLNTEITTPIKQIVTPERTLDRYSIESLSKADIKEATFTRKKLLRDEKDYYPWLIEMEFNANVDGKSMKKTTGQLNIPMQKEDEEAKYPLVVMFRGYIDQSTFKTGDGTKNASAYFAKNGFITVAPDFLGYGGSDKEAGNIFETRFQTYVTAISLLTSIKNTSFQNITDGKWDGKNIFIWAHSNGGQVTFTTLEVTKVDYPTALWAPVSKPFPYSVLYYTDQSDDGGKLIRRELAKFEDLYDTDLYSLTKYLDRISAPINISQGGMDDAIPLAWSQDIVHRLKSLKKDITLDVYPKSDHNMRPDWDEVVNKNLEFFKSHLKDE